ncbi:MAG: OprO/OprP family phosphate-selective porin [Gemmatimonadetes bacterium]|nr:OprO/OprP family phosphate-selective porin [Gemmatimonadota bacterium]
MRPRAGASLGALIGVGLLAFAQGTAAQQFTTDAARIDLSGRFQTQLRGSSCSSFATGDAGSACSEDVPGLDLFIRRARLTIDVTFNDWISGKFQPEYGEEFGDLTLKDAYGLLNLNPEAENTHAQIRIGHFKRPFDGFQMTSSTQILTIERDIDIPGVAGLTALSFDELTTANDLSDRDIGVMVDGSLDAEGSLHYWAGVFNGRGPRDNEDLNGQKQFVGRLRYSTSAGEHPLAINGAIAITDIPFTRSDETLDGRYFAALELFAELGNHSAGPHVQAGLVFGKNGLQNEAGTTPDHEAEDPLASMVSWQAIGTWKLEVEDGYFFTAIEPLFRVTVSDPNRDVEGDRVTALTPGVQVFFGGRNKLAINWDFVSLGGGLDSENSFKAQYQFHF